MTDADIINVPGTGEDAWRAWTRISEFPDAGIADSPSVAIVAAHPDDEVLGAGGTIAVLAEAGARMRLIAVTDGEAYHPDCPDPESLARRRAEETSAALAALGVDGAVEVIRLGMPDSGLVAREDELAVRLSELTEGFSLCLAPWEWDKHPDHDAAGRAVRRMHPRVLGYPIWLWHWAQPDDPRVPWEKAAQFSLPAWAVERKRAAIECFASQMEERDGGLEPVLPPEMIAHFTRDCEVLMR
ncbi:MAG TPA: PIG-L family deacetylase [Trebonia sp.]|nr:PIG-L family deacetylase [Trebonia sp.]